MKLKYYYIILVLLVVVQGCRNENKTSNEELLDVDLSIDSVKQNAHVKRVKKIFYNVPSPIEMTALMEKAGAEFQPSVLNSIDKADTYTSVNKMALNLGVYGSDVSYTRIFDQIQMTINYLSGIKTLADGLGIPQDKGSLTVERIEENINNRDSLLKIVADTYSSADEYLKQNNRGSTAALIIAGGWIEGLYIAVSIVGEDENYNQEILNRISEQKFSIVNLIELLKVYSDNDKYIKTCLPKLEKLKIIFDEVDITYTKGEVITNPETKTTLIKSQAVVNITTDELNRIKENITSLRNQIVK